LRCEGTAMVGGAGFLQVRHGQRFFVPGAHLLLYYTYICSLRQ
jgi:hypothetical protein